MTIAERKAREAYDRENPWRQIATITDDMIGMICELRTSYHGTATDQGHRRFFNDRNDWHQIEPPAKLWTWSPIIEWRPTGTRLAEYRHRSVIRRAEYGSYEYRGGRLYRKPKQYKLYWRADDA